MFDSTLDYAQRFSRYKDKALIEEVRQYVTFFLPSLSLSLWKSVCFSHSYPFELLYILRILKKYALLDYEAVQIGDLCPENTEEARALIPSLHNQEDRVLQALLDDLSKLRKYT